MHQIQFKTEIPTVGDSIGRSPLRRGFLLPALVFACIPLLSVHALADATITATGFAFCYDGTTQTFHPMEGVRVELMDSDCDGSQICDDEMGRNWVQADGSFRVTGSGGDPGWIGSDPDVYLRFAYNDDEGVRLTDELDSTRSWNTPEHDHDNTGDGTNIDFGSWSTGNGVDPGEGTQCGVWSEGRNAFRAYRTEIGAEPPAGHLDIEYWSAIYAGTPWTNTDTIHWPIHFSSRAMRHEFGHSIRHAADGDARHFTDDVVKYRYARNHPNGCAEDDNAQQGELLESVIGYNFNEGWADYWEGRVGGCGGAILTDRVELQVAAQLNALQHANGLTRADMVSVLIANPGAIHSMDEFSNALRESHVGINQNPLIVAGTPPVNYAPYTEARRASLIAAQIEQISTQISNLRSQALASHRATDDSVERPCKGKNCEDIFKRAVAPAFLRGKAKILEIRLSALKRAARPDWALQVQRELKTGRYSAFMEEYRSNLRAAMRKELLESIKQAQMSVRRIQSRLSPAAFDVSLSTLAKAAARLEPQTSGKLGAIDYPLGWLPQVSLAEDRGRATRPGDPASSNAPPRSPSEASLSVPANANWVGTGITLSRGQHLAVDAQGTWSNSGPPAKGPKGFENYKYPGTLMANEDLASLIAKVGETMFGVGEHFDGASPANGELYLTINDTPGTFGDNQGALSVQVSKY
jgi:hypothetical protein